MFSLSDARIKTIFKKKGLKLIKKVSDRQIIEILAITFSIFYHPRHHTALNAPLYMCHGAPFMR